MSEWKAAMFPTGKAKEEEVFHGIKYFGGFAFLGTSLSTYIFCTYAPQNNL